MNEMSISELFKSLTAHKSAAEVKATLENINGEGDFTIMELSKICEALDLDFSIKLVKERNYGQYNRRPDSRIGRTNNFWGSNRRIY